MVNASDFVAEIIRIYQQGCGYIWGTYGQLWTEALQKKGSKENNAKTQAYGRQWLGYNVYDCSGMPYAVLKKLGLSIPHGCNSIWKNGYLSEKGKTSALPMKKRLPGMPVFLTTGDNRHHMGTYIGGGWCIEAKGTQTGVVISKWEHWDEAGYYRGMDYNLPYDWELPEFHFDIYPPINGFSTCRSGYSGASVRYVQVLLRDRWSDDITVDNYYGSATIAAVKAFQEAHRLDVDGVVGPLTIAALEKELPIGVEPDRVPVQPPDTPAPAWAETVQQLQTLMGQNADNLERMRQMVNALDYMKEG